MSFLGLGTTQGAKNLQNQASGASAQAATNATTGADLSAGYSAQATPLINQGTSALGSSLNYWSNILNGNSNAISTELGPTIQQVKQGNTNALNTASQFGPRGGATASTLSQIPFQQAGTIGNLVAGLQPEAAQQVAGIGSTLANTGAAVGGLGISALNASTGAAGSASQTYLNQLALLQKQQQQQFLMGSAAGQGLGGAASSGITAGISGGAGGSAGSAGQILAAILGGG